MINPDTIIKLKGTSKDTRNQVIEILLDNYKQFLSVLEVESDYCTVTNSWFNYKPMVGNIVSAEDFIKKHSKNHNNMSKISFNKGSLVTQAIQKEATKIVTANLSVNRIFAIDCSGSMYSDLPAVREQLKNKIPSLVNENDTVSIIWFSGRNECGVLQEGVKVSSLADLEKLNQAIDRWLKPVCLTGFKEPLLLTREVAERLSKKNPSSVSTLTFMTDGYDNQWSEGEIIKATQDLDDVISAVTFIEYGWYCNRNLMNKMADAIGGVLVFNEDFYQYDEVVKNELTKKILDKKKIEVSLDHTPKDGVAYGLTGDNDIITYVVDMSNKILVSSSITNVFYLVEDTDGTSIDLINFDSSEMGDIYRILAHLTQKMKSDDIFDIIGSMGDIDLYTKFTNCFSKQDYTYFQNECIDCANGERFKGGRDPKFVPKDDAYTVLDVLDELASDPINRVGIYDDNFDYKKISATRAQKTGVELNKAEIEEMLKNATTSEEITDLANKLKDAVSNEKKELKFIPNQEFKDYGCSISKLTFNEDRPNVSILVKVDGTVDLSVYGDKKPKDLPDTVDTFIFRNYSIVADGIKNVKVLPAIIGEYTYHIFKENGVKMTILDGGTMDGVNSVYSVLIKLSDIPVVNRKMATNISAKEFFNKNVELLKAGALQKVLKFYNEQYNEKRSTGYDSKYGEHVTNWLKEIGITEYNGFSPKTEKTESTDEYIGKQMKVSIKSCSTLPPVKKVSEKLATGKKLTKSEMLIESALNMYGEFTESSIYKNSSNQDNLMKTWIGDETKATIAKNRKLIKDIASMKMGIVLGHTWFSEFESLDENEMVVNVDGEDFECKVDLTDIAIKI